MPSQTTQSVRPSAIVGTFYPADATALTNMVSQHLAEARPTRLSPKALIAPHAGLICSGPVAGTAYRSVADRASEITRVILLGPPHRVAVHKFCVPGKK